MNINAINKINFGSIKLYNAQLSYENVLGEKKPVRAYISLLEKSDLERFDLQDDLWLDGYGNKTFGNDVIFDLKSSKNNEYWDNFYFIGIECPEECDGKKIKAIAEAVKSDKNLKLSLLQSKTATEDIFERTKGASACIIYLLTKMLQKLNKDQIKVSSYDDNSTSFYKKFGFEQEKGRDYAMQQAIIPELQKMLEEKYQITPIEHQMHLFI